MWLPWNLQPGVALLGAAVFALATAMMLSRAAWVLPRKIDPALPPPGRFHLRCRGGFLAISPLAALACIWQFGVTPAAVCAIAFVLTLLALAWIDVETGMLPDLLSLPLLWVGLLVNLEGGFVQLPEAVLGAAAGYLVLWMVHWGFKLCTGREGLGYGDFKLLAALGAWLGWAMLPGLLLCSSSLALMVALGMRLAGRMRPGEALSFGPYLASAGILSLFGVFHI